MQYFSIQVSNVFGIQNIFCCCFFCGLQSLGNSLLCLYHPFMIFEGCLDSNPKCCRCKRSRYRLSAATHPSVLQNMKYITATLQPFQLKFLILCQATKILSTGAWWWWETLSYDKSDVTELAEPPDVLHGWEAGAGVVAVVEHRRLRAVRQLHMLGLTQRAATNIFLTANCKF
jgi:hypothetical protein